MTKIIGFAGLKGAGKDTAASVLIDEFGFTNLKMAGGLKAMTYAYLSYIGVPDHTAYRLVDGDLKETPHEAFAGKTSRLFQQVLGTECGRTYFGIDFWVDAFKAATKTHSKVVCTDVRFPNEVAAIRELGGEVYRINNFSAIPENVIHNPTWLDHLLVKMGWSKGLILHPSERYVLSLDVDGELDNNGSIEDLHEQVLSLAYSFH